MQQTNDSLDYFNYRHPLRSFVSRLSVYLRDAQYREFESLIRPKTNETILDVGVTPDQSLADSNFFISRFPHKHQLLATSIEDASKAMNELGVKFQQVPPGPLPFADQRFDVVVSWAVLEHVGSNESQEKFVKEMARLGRKFFLITPYRGFPLEVHTLLPLVHWLPHRAYRWIFRKLGMTQFADEAHLNLLWARQARRMIRNVPGAKVRISRLFGIIPSHLMVYRSDKAEPRT
jgi:hypothetical protein